MKISLFQGILIGIFAVAGLLGLYVFAVYTNNGGAGGVGNVTIWGTLPDGDMRAGLTASVKAESSLARVTYVEKDAATLPAALSAAIATGGAPDLVLASQEELAALAPLLSPIPLATLSERSFESAFVGEGALFAAPEEGGHYGLPLLMDPMVLFYNRAILASDGIARPPSTWEALAGLAPNVTTLTASRQITRALVAFGTYGNVRNARGILSTLFLQTNVPISARSGPTGIITADLGRQSPPEGGAAPGTASVRFFTQFADPSKVSYTWNASLPDSRSAFLTGDLALYLGFASEARFLKEASPNLDFDAAQMPQPATAATSKTYGLAYALMIPRGAKNPRGAYAAAAYLTNTPEQLALAKATGLAPAARAALEAEVPADAIAAVTQKSALISAGWLSPVPADTDRVFSPMIENVVSGKSSVETALDTAERSLTALFVQLNP